MGEHVFAGAPDARQSTETNHPVSRFRPTYRALTPEEKALHDAIKAKAVELEQLFEQVAFPPVSNDQCRYRALSFTALEESVMWAVKALTA